MAAYRFGLERCVLQINYHMKKLLDENNVLKILKKADEYQIWRIKKICFRYIASNYEKVVHLSGKK